MGYITEHKAVNPCWYNAVQALVQCIVFAGKCKLYVSFKLIAATLFNWNFQLKLCLADAILNFKWVNIIQI